MGITVDEGGMGVGMGVGVGALLTDGSEEGIWLTVQPPLPLSIRSCVSFFLLSKRFRSFRMLSGHFVLFFCKHNTFAPVYALSAGPVQRRPGAFFRFLPLFSRFLPFCQKELEGFAPN
jgi:hypothetical protein